MDGIGMDGIGMEGIGALGGIWMPSDHERGPAVGMAEPAAGACGRAFCGPNGRAVGMGGICEGHSAV